MKCESTNIRKFVWIRKLALIQGFTILETIVAIAVLITAVTSPLLLASNSIRSAVLSKDKVIASYLGAEAIEYIRNIRDSNVIKGNFWLEGFLTECSSNEGCEIDVTEPILVDAIRSCAFRDCPRQLKYDDLAPSPSYRYQYLTGEETKFTRVVKIEAISYSQEAEPFEAKVKVEIGWEDRSLVLQENIFNWR